MKILLSVLLVLFLLPVLVSATVTVTVSQSGADPSSVMSGRTFTVTASGWSGDCNSANLDLSGCPVCNVSESTTKSISSSSVSWTTLTASGTATSQSISVSISGTCSPDSGSASFDVKTAPSLSATVSPTSTSVAQGSTFTLSLNIQNSGETTAQFGSITVSPSDFSISSGCSPSSISGGQSSGISCTILASSSATTGDRTLTLTITPSNSDSLTKTATVTVSATSATTTTISSGGATVDGGEVPGTKVNVTRGKATITIPSIAAGKRAVVNITKTEDMAVSKITISVKNSVNNIKLEITKVEQKPASITIEVSGNVYHYLEINKTNVKDTDVNNATIQFRVEKSWINVNNIDMNTIALHRFANNIWNKLSTTKVSEDTENVYYESISPGLSVFAISGETVSATTTLPTTTIPTTTTLPLISVKPSDIWIYLIILIVVISLVLFAVLKLRKKKHE